MSRIPANRFGYIGYSCDPSAITPYYVGPMDCVSNRYLLAPRDYERNTDSETYYSTVYSLMADLVYISKIKKIGFNKNPFTGDYFNLYNNLNALALPIFTLPCYSDPQPCATSIPQKFPVGYIKPPVPTIPYFTLGDASSPIPPVMSWDSVVSMKMDGYAFIYYIQHFHNGNKIGPPVAQTPVFNLAECPPP